MDPIRGFCARLRVLASTLDCETARLQRALDGEDSDFEDYPMRILHDLNSEVQTLKDDINNLLDKARLENQENIGFIKATKVVMAKNSTDILKIRELFQKYGYNPRVKKDTELEQEGPGSAPETSWCEDRQEPGAEGAQFCPAVPGKVASEKPPRSPQLSDFGLERYMIPQVLQNPAPNQKEEPDSETPPTKQSLVQVLRTPRCALKMDDFECVTPKLEHFGISEYTMCLNEDYTMGLKNLNIKSEEATQTDLTANHNCVATPGPMIQKLEKSDAVCTNSPMAPAFCTPGLKIPSAKKNTAMVSRNYSLSKSNSSSNDLEVKDCTSLVLSSDECFENSVDPSSPTISSYEGLLKTPPPPEITVVPEDILQILSRYNSNLATPIAMKAVPPRKAFLRWEGRSTRSTANKENC